MDWIGSHHSPEWSRIRMPSQSPGKTNWKLNLFDWDRSSVHSKDCTETNLFHFSSSFKPEYIIPLVGGGSILFGVLFYCICCRGKGRSSKWDRWVEYSVHPGLISSENPRCQSQHSQPANLYWGQNSPETGRWKWEARSGPKPGQHGGDQLIVSRKFIINHYLILVS